jgi:hypothetical protein
MYQIIMTKCTIIIPTSKIREVIYYKVTFATSTLICFLFDQIVLSTQKLTWVELKKPPLTIN